MSLVTVSAKSVKFTSTGPRFPTQNKERFGLVAIGTSTCPACSYLRDEMGRAAQRDPSGSYIYVSIDDDPMFLGRLIAQSKIVVDAVPCVFVVDNNGVAVDRLTGGVAPSAERLVNTLINTRRKRRMVGGLSVVPKRSRWDEGFLYNQMFWSDGFMKISS